MKSVFRIDLTTWEQAESSARGSSPCQVRPFAALLPLTGWSRGQGESYGRKRGQKTRTLTHSPICSLNMSKQEATAGPRLPKELYTPERSGGGGKCFTKKQNRNWGFPGNTCGLLLLLLLLFGQKGPSVWEATPERRIQGRGNSTGSGVQILASQPGSAFSSRGALGKSFHLSGLSFLITKMERPTPSHVRGCVVPRTFQAHKQR